MDAERREVTLRSKRDREGTRALWAYLNENGDLYVDGQDLGSGVSGAFGAGITEYEWSHMIKKNDIPSLVKALNGNPGEDILDILKKHFDKEPRFEISDFCERRRIPVDFWCRRGD